MALLEAAVAKEEARIVSPASSFVRLCTNVLAEADTCAATRTSPAAFAWELALKAADMAVAAAAAEISASLLPAEKDCRVGAIR